MAERTYRVFLSAVTSELGAARAAVATELRARKLTVVVQEEFTQHPDTTLRKLHDYIRDCDAVVCLIGRRDGSLPPAKAAAPFRAMLPDGIADASYTQWELFFAVAHKRRLLRFITDDGFYSPDKPPEWEAWQQAFVAHLTEEAGRDRERGVGRTGAGRADLAASRSAGTACAGGGGLRRQGGDRRADFAADEQCGATARRQGAARRG